MKDLTVETTEARDSARLCSQQTVEAARVAEVMTMRSEEVHTAMVRDTYHLLL